MRLLFFGVFIMFFYTESICSVLKLNNSEHPDLCICDSTKIIQNTSNIEGYTEFNSYYPGEGINLFVSSMTKGFNIEIVNQSINPTSVLKLKSNKGKVQNYNECSFAIGCKWELSEVIKLPQEIWSGYYIIKLSNKIILLSTSFAAIVALLTNFITRIIPVFI